jgi:hypothetical protein
MGRHPCGGGQRVQHQGRQRLAVLVVLEQGAAMLAGIKGLPVHAQGMVAELAHVHADRHHVKAAARGQLEVLPGHHGQRLATLEVPTQVPGLATGADGHAQRHAAGPRAASLQHGLVGGLAEELCGAQAQRLQPALEAARRHLLIALLPLGQQGRVVIDVKGLATAVEHGQTGASAPGRNALERDCGL